MEKIITLASTGLSFILHLAVLLQYVCVDCRPIEQYHQRIGIKSFVCGAKIDGWPADFMY